MSNTLLKQRGGGQLGDLLPMYVKTFKGATWPFCRLIMTDTDITFFFLRKQLTLGYRDLKAIKISRWGYIQFVAIEPSLNFAFSSLGLPKIIAILKSKNVALDPIELKKLNTALAAVVIQAAFVAVVLAIVILQLV